MLSEEKIISNMDMMTQQKIHCLQVSKILLCYYNSDDSYC